MRVGLALAAGLVLLAIALGVTLTRSPPTVAWSNAAPLNGTILKTERGGGQACQTHQVLPAGVSAVRLSLYDAYGPRVSVKVLSGDRVLTSGVLGSGWIGQSPTIPLRPVSHSSSDVRVCFTLGQPAGIVAIQGSEASAGEALTFAGEQGQRTRMRVEYVKSGNDSWWSLASSVARHMGLGHWPAGTWLALLVMAMMAAIAAGAAWLTARELR